mgnify:CR=1 FL=1
MKIIRATPAMAIEKYGIDVALPGMLVPLNWPGFSALAIKAGTGLAGRGLANLTAMAEERSRS